MSYDGDFRGERCPEGVIFCVCGVDPAKIRAWLVYAYRTYAPELSGGLNLNHGDLRRPSPDNI